MLIINPGTEKRPDATASNAAAIAAGIFDDIKAEFPAGLSVGRQAEHDADGWFRFQFASGQHTVDVDIPGDDPEEVYAGQPFVSRRLYVDGSSWLYGYAVGRIAERLGAEEV